MPEVCVASCSSVMRPAVSSGRSGRGISSFRGVSSLNSPRSTNSASRVPVKIWVSEPSSYSESAAGGGPSPRRACTWCTPRCVMPTHSAAEGYARR